MDYKIMPDEQPSGFLNRAIVVLFLVFSIPASLTLAGTYYVAIQGRVPGGVDSRCETNIAQDVILRLDLYDYTAGLVEFEIQTVSIVDDTGTVRELFSDTIPVPQSLTCENIISRLDDANIVLQNQKSIAWSPDNGMTWNVYNVCDEPRPQNGRCDAETLSIASVDLNPHGNGLLSIVESDVDEFGEPQRDAEGNPIALNQWSVTTTNSGATWVLLQTP